MGAGDLIAQNTTHADRVSRLIEQWQDKPDLVSILRSYLAQAQDIEDALFEIINERDLDSAVGVQLDTLGRLVKQPRTTSDDARFRTSIRARIAINRSNGTAEDLIKVASLLLSEFGELFKLRDEPPAQLRLTVADPLQSTDADLAALLLDEADCGGVRLMFQFNAALTLITDRLVLGDDGGAATAGGLLGSTTGSTTSPGGLSSVIGT